MARTTKNPPGSSRRIEENPRAPRARASTATSALSRGGRAGMAHTEIAEPIGRPASEVWQARIGADLAAQLHADAEVLGLAGRSEIVRAALELLHRQAAEQRMATSVEDFYGDATPPLPLGVFDGDDGDS